MACTASKTPLLRRVAARGYAASAQASPKVTSKTTEVETTTLPNKLIVASSDVNSPLARVSILFRAGSRNENYDNLGATHLLRVAAGLTTKNATQFGIMRNLQQIGSSLDITTDREIVTYTIESTLNHIEEAMKFLQDAATLQLFKPWELSEILPRLKYDLARVPDKVRAIELLHQAAYRTGLGNSLYCPKYQVGKHSSETLQHYYASNFTTNRAAVVGVGIDHKMLTSFAKGLALESSNSNDSASKYHGANEIRYDKSGNFAHVAIATEGGSLKNNKEALAFAVLQQSASSGTTIKRGNNNGALGKVISRALDGKAFGFRSLNASYTDSGLFGFILSANSSDIGKAIDAGIKGLKSGNITNEDVARGKANLKASVLYNYESLSNLNEDMGSQVLLTGNVQSAQAIVSAIDAVSHADVNAAARKVASGKLSIAAVGNLANVPYVNQIN